MPAQPTNQAALDEQARQAALTALLVQAMSRIWPLIDLHDLKATLPKYETALTALVHKYGQASATLAARFYQQQRLDAGITGRHQVTPADPAPFGQVQTAVEWATKGLWTPVTEPDATPGPLELPGHVRNAQTLTEGAAQKLVTDTGRNTLIAAIEADMKCRGWARQAKPNACAFCALLSTRGAVYRSEQTASFEAHNGCHCVPVPLFADHYEPPAYIRDWEAQYARATSSVDGSRAKRIAWRQAYEGRTAEQPVLTPA